jgi:Na+/glutamate symporter
MAVQNASDITWWAVASAFGGTIIGAVLGGIISFWLQRKSLAAAKALHDADRRDIRKTLGYALLFKMIRLSSDLAQLGIPVDEASRKQQARVVPTNFGPSFCLPSRCQIQ